MKITFLNRDLEDEVYMCQPKGFQIQKNSHSNCKRKQSMYGLNQESQHWDVKFSNIVFSYGLIENTIDGINVYTLRSLEIYIVYMLMTSCK